MPPLKNKRGEAIGQVRVEHVVPLKKWERARAGGDNSCGVRQLVYRTASAESDPPAPTVTVRPGDPGARQTSAIARQRPLPPMLLRASRRVAVVHVHVRRSAIGASVSAMLLKVLPPTLFTARPAVHRGVHPRRERAPG